ncbi:hypothetical protein VKT23_000473 [Stygiomarasmius scandens]|uniref:Crinkler (CRN) family protein n=1 Tax=Marasmiellus scandens TaxID=2682957 RepID=A0ABR1K631_9AGAR
MQPAPVVNPYQVMTMDQVVLQPPRLDPKVRLSNNADPEQWKWPGSERWSRAPPDWQSFYSVWNGATVDPLKANDLSTISTNGFFPDFVVRNSYKLMVDKVLNAGLKSPSNGALLTGQPGVGKSFWRFYLLICLLFREQSVLFTETKVNYLFHQGTVYEMPEDVMSRSLLPESKSRSESQRVFLWSLIDTDDKNQPIPGYLYARQCYPVHTSSPNSVCFSVWRKERNPDLFSFTRWSDEELFAGFLVQPECPTFCIELQKYMENSADTPVPNEPGHQRAYDILRKCRDSSREDPSEEDSSNVETKSMILEAALKALLKATTEEIDVAPRDVYQIIFKLNTVIQVG